MGCRVNGSDVVGDGTDVGYGPGRDGGGGVSSDGGGRRCIVVVQGVQGWWFKDPWFEEQYMQHMRA